MVLQIFAIHATGALADVGALAPGAAGGTFHTLVDVKDVSEGTDFTDVIGARCHLVAREFCGIVGVSAQAAITFAGVS